MCAVSVTLVLAAVVAGLATFLSPCALPIIPVVLATSATGGRRRPLGVAVGLARVVRRVHARRLARALGARAAAGLLHTIAIVLLAFAGLMLLVPALAEWAGRLFQPIATRASGALPTGDGFLSGIALGAALSVVWTPCAGPILAAVTALAAQDEVSGSLVIITVAYAAGATLPLFALALFGQRAFSGLRGRAPPRPAAAPHRRRRAPARRVALHDEPADAPGGGHAGLSLVDPEARAGLAPSSTTCARSTARRRTRRPRWPPARRRTASRTTVRRRTSPASRPGSTRPDPGRSRSPSCAGRSCSSTSGPTPA